MLTNRSTTLNIQHGNDAQIVDEDALPTNQSGGENSFNEIDAEFELEPYGEPTETDAKTEDEEEETEQDKTEPESLTPEQQRLKEIQEKLGIKLEDIGADEKGNEKETEAAKEENKESGETDKDTDSFTTAFESKFGVKPDEALGVFNELIQFKQMVEQMGGVEALSHIRVQQQERSLQQAWGVGDSEFKERLGVIREYYKTLPPALQKSLDNPDGAQLLWAKIENEMGTNSLNTMQRGRNVTPGQRVTNPVKKHTVQDLLDMSETDYKNLDWSKIDRTTVDFDTSRITKW